MENVEFYLKIGEIFSGILVAVSFVSFVYFLNKAIDKYCAVERERIAEAKKVMPLLEELNAKAEDKDKE